MTRRVIAFLALACANTALAQTVAGNTLTMVLTTKTTATGAGTSDVPLPRQYFRGVITAAAGRSRMDIDSASGDSPYRKGEYSLTDAAGNVTVRPATKTFVAAPDMSDINVDSLLANSGISMKTKVIKARVDSLGPGERIDGRATMHYRIQLTQSFSIEAKDMPMNPDLASALGSEITMTLDFWYANIPDMPLNPMFDDMSARLPMRKGAPGSFMKTMDSLFTKLPQGRMQVRSATTAAYGANGVLMILETQTELRNMKAAQVELRRLAVPDDYKEFVEPNQNPMIPFTPQKNVARWKASAWMAQQTKKP